MQVDIDMTENMVDYMAEARPKALQALKAMAEKPAPKLAVSVVVNASPETVWNAWTTPADIMQWNHA